MSCVSFLFAWACSLSSYERPKYLPNSFLLRLLWLHSIDQLSRACEGRVELHVSGRSKPDGWKWWMGWFSLPHAKLRTGCTRSEVAFLPPLRPRGTCFERRDGLLPRSLRHDRPTTRTSDFFGLPRPRFHPLFLRASMPGMAPPGLPRHVRLGSLLSPGFVPTSFSILQWTKPPFGGGMDGPR